MNITAVDYSINEKSIIMAAFLNDNKHPDLLLKAWKNLKAFFPDWHVTIMGNGEVERFKAMAQTIGLDDSVTFLVILLANKRRMFGIKQASIVCVPAMRISLWWYRKSGQEILL